MSITVACEGGSNRTDCVRDSLLSGVYEIESRFLAFGGHAQWKILMEQSEAAREEAFCRGYYEGREGMKMLDFRLQTAGSILNQKGLWQWRKSRTVL